MPFMSGSSSGIAIEVVGAVTAVVTVAELAEAVNGVLEPEALSGWSVVAAGSVATVEDEFGSWPVPTAWAVAGTGGKVSSLLPPQLARTTEANTKGTQRLIPRRGRSPSFMVLMLTGDEVVRTTTVLRRTTRIGL